jgi:hypothetical protein
MAVLSRFNRAQHNRVFEGVTQELVESARQYYHNLQETMKHLGSTRGYQAYFENWAPDHVGEAESLVENLRNMFVEQTLDARIEAALPTLAKIQQQGNNMKEAQIFENWINNLSEGTWALPETPEQMEKLNQLMSAELIVGPDATNAKELLGDIVGDEKLFDILGDLADNDPRANIWDDSDVQRRLAELGVQTPQSTAAEPADIEQDTAPEVKEDQLDEIDIDTLNQLASHPMAGTMAAAGGAAIGGVIGKGIEKAADWYKGKKEQQALARHKQQGVAEGDNRSTFVEDRELAEMLKYAGVPVSEGVLNDDTRNTWDHLLDRFRHEVENFKQGSDLDSDLYDALFDYYSQHGAMPYGVAKNKPGFPEAAQWVSDRLADDLGIKENLIAPQIMPVSEGSCNMTMEGEYCPEHGLAECGGMYEDGGAVGMPYSMGEGNDDPINSNSAMTGSYYEGKETKSQEGDALLARIKSLALLR